MQDKKTSVEKFEEFFSREEYNDKIVDALDKFPDSNVVVDHQSLSNIYPKLAEFIITRPTEVIKAAQKAIRNLDPLNRDVDIEILFDLITLISLNDVKSRNIGNLIVFNARIVEAYSIEPMISISVFECKSCMKLHNIFQNSHFLSEPTLCQECGGRNFRLLQGESEFIDSQKFVFEGINVGESRRFNAILKGSLIEYNKFQEGMEVSVTAIPRFLRDKNGNQIYLEVNNIVNTSKDQDHLLNYDKENEPFPKSNVYFISDGEFVKIGKADDPDKRFSSIKTSNPKPLKLLYTMKGDGKLESFLHELFADYWVRGEWFRVDGNLKEFLRRGYIIGTHETVKHYADFDNETGNKDKKDGRMSKEDRDKIKCITGVIKQIGEEYDGKAHRDLIIIEMEKMFGLDEDGIDVFINFLKRRGTIYEPNKGYYKLA